MEITSKDIGIPLILGLIVNILSAYLFSLKLISFNSLLLITITSLIVIIIAGIQLKISEIKDEIINQQTEQKRLDEKLKIHEQLINMKSEIKELQKKVFKR